MSGFGRRNFQGTSADNLRQDVDKILSSLRGTKRLDLYEPARIDPNVSVEDMMATLVQLRSEGKFDYIGLSECRADTLRRANAVSGSETIQSLTYRYFS